MGVFVALYRGINVGGKHSIKMESLRALHERLGHRDVQSYIQSGNVVFSASGTVAAITKKLAAEFASEFSFAAKIVVVESTRWLEIVKNNPYSKFAVANPKLVHLGVCEGEPSAAGLQALLTKTGGTETFTIGKGIVYLHAPDGFGTSKFAAGMEKASGVPMTVRNWRTVEALQEMIQAVG
ncbi:DUF1697 domain-containing protein [Anatilimnocola sp. NA78]|uniref:DUF1697 domain-containing protein n=1 Tax=Anatilimnocola sp. NA78 TaxID=3415683 RepID=UPI003CE59DD2